MDTSIFLARLLGPSMLVIGLGLLLNRATYRDLSLEVLDSPALIYLAGLIALVAGRRLAGGHHHLRLGESCRRHLPHRVPRVGGAARAAADRRPRLSDRRHRPISLARRVAELCRICRGGRVVQGGPRP
jgi:hypothetical protein